MTDREHIKTRISVLDLDLKFSDKNTDWPAVRIRYELAMRGISLAALNSFHDSAAGRALRVSWPELERIIAEALGQSPQAIWPSRYTDDGIPRKYLARSRRGRREGGA